MSELSLISVVCPTYNSAKYIQKTINVLLEQQRVPFEVVFSDDGSVDETVGIIESNRNSFLQKGISLVVLKNKHQGPGATRNAGIKVAQGNWIAFLDADDTWTINKLSRVFEEMQKKSDTNFIVHWEKYTRLDGSESVLKHGEGYDENKNLPRQLYKTNFFSTSTVVCQKEILKTVGGFDETLPVSQDYELWLRMSPDLKVSIIREFLGSYVEMPGSITAKPYIKRYIPLMRILFRHRQKGGVFLFLKRSLRARLSKQWFSNLKQMLSGKKGHV